MYLVLEWVGNDAGKARRTNQSLREKVPAYLCFDCSDLNIFTVINLRHFVFYKYVTQATFNKDKTTLPSTSQLHASDAFTATKIQRNPRGSAGIPRYIKESLDEYNLRRSKY